MKNDYSRSCNHSSGAATLQAHAMGDHGGDYRDPNCSVCQGDRNLNAYSAVLRSLRQAAAAEHKGK